MSELVQKIKGLPIYLVAEKLGIKVNRNGFAVCFAGHDRKAPSLKFNKNNNLWKCFGCDLGGSNIDLVEKVLNIDFKSALTWFKNNFNLDKDYSYANFSNSKIISNKITPYNNSFNYEPNPEIYEFLYRKLSLSPSGKTFFVRRGYDLSIIKSLNIVDILEPRNVFKELKDNWSLKELECAGLTRYNEAKRNYYFIWWKPCILFPFYDPNNKLIYLQGRSLESKSDLKYINLAGLPKPIYNLSRLSKIKTGESIYLFEGVTDTIMGIQEGFNSFGILGASSFKEEWVKQFLQFKVFVIPDNDNAGEVFAKQITTSFSKVGKNVLVRPIPYGKDFSEYVILKKQQYGIKPHR